MAASIRDISVKAVLIGCVVSIAAAVIIALVGSMIYIGLSPEGLDGFKQHKLPFDPLGLPFQTVVVSFGFVVTFVGCFVTARIAKGSEFLNVGVLALLSLLPNIPMWASYFWYNLASTLAVAFAAFLAASLAKARK